MDQFILDTGILIGLFVTLIVCKLLKIRASLFIAISGLLYFAIEFLIILANDDFTVWPIIYSLVCGGYIIAGGKKVAYKTQTAVFDEISSKPIRVMNAGTNWADPLLEKTTISVDGESNLSADLQALKIEIHSTPEMQTKERGIKAIVKEVVFMLQFIETNNSLHNIEMLFEIEGGVETIKRRINAFVLEFFLDEIGRTTPLDLDTDKGKTLRRLARKLKMKVNKFCKINSYPYEIPCGSMVTIGDTQLEDAYYQVLAEKVFAILKQDAQDTVAERLRMRLIDTGKTLLPTGTEEQQLAAAQISLSIVKKDIKESKFSFGGDTAQLFKDIALILKKP